MKIKFERKKTHGWWNCKKKKTKKDPKQNNGDQIWKIKNKRGEIEKQL
jgi:hypothetical protein